MLNKYKKLTPNEKLNLIKELISILCFISIFVTAIILATIGQESMQKHWTNVAVIDLFGLGMAHKGKHG